jgi:hypothetical protein
VYGKINLTNNYITQAKEFLNQESKRESGMSNYYEARAFQRLTEGSVEFDYLDISKTEKLEGNIVNYEPKVVGNDATGIFFNAKQEIYRLPDRLLYDLAFYYAINSNSVWDAIEQLQKKCVINDEAAKNLLYAASFATLLRLRVYQHYNQQKDDISVSACDSIIDQTIFYLPKHYSGELFKYILIKLQQFERMELVNIMKSMEMRRFILSKTIGDKERGDIAQNQVLEKMRGKGIRDVDAHDVLGVKELQLYYSYKNNINRRYIRVLYEAIFILKNEVKFPLRAEEYLLKQLKICEVNAQGLFDSYNPLPHIVAKELLEVNY